ncbi:flagellar filament capping protein FliD [Catenovulum maritimum]|uniref:Flagellar hook-associated protein 2 n=1 Tax=Catenovulum maritimum TaxID=1513271 RepID=A0A0J8H0S5_9ALTE|nr:flagellar filament capping protein FliD [Catenovulum maritimum]KMT66618.1 flagellar hook protein [Catenovulum maritimum]
MSVSSIGVGSGLDLSGLVTQLLEAERAPRQARLDSREEELETSISAIATLKSKMEEFKDSVDELRNSYDLQGRKAILSHPDLGEGETGPFTAEASNSAVQNEYEITVDQLASGSRITTGDGNFTNGSSSIISTQAGNLTFNIGSDSFIVPVTANMTLSEYRTAVNTAGEDFGVRASIIETGTSDGTKLVYTSDTTGADNNLSIVNTDDIVELEKISTESSAGSSYAYDEDLVGGDDVTKIRITDAQNAQATIDGIVVESETNEFENVIENVTFEATAVSSVDASGAKQASTLEIGYDKEGLKNKITDFVDNYNTMLDEIATLTRYGTSELEDDGALAGDFMLRGIESGLSSILSSSVSASELGSLFQIGVAFTDKGKLEVSAVDEFGFGSGEELLDEALDDNYDEIAALFSDDDEGIANRLYDYIYEYTTFGGLLPSREQSYKDQKDQLGDDRARFEIQMSDYETLLRKKYINLDLTVSKLQRTGSSLMASLSSSFI